LLGRLSDDPETYRRLRKTLDFELVFGELRERARVRQTTDAISSAARMEDAILDVFGETNRAFGLLDGLNFSERTDFSVIAFLSLFDEIYSLNQDLLLEAHYVPSPTSKYWKGPEFPGVTPPSGWREMKPGERILGAWQLSPTMSTEAGHQLIYKLHGSVNWREQSGSRLLVLGGGKVETIGNSSLLSSYFEHFTSRLMAGGTKLMVIGYSFHDDHINKAIVRASNEAGLQIYLVEPRGLGVFERYPSTAIRGPNELDDLRITGVSTRTFDAIFRGDSLQLQSLMRFAEA